MEKSGSIKGGRKLTASGQRDMDLIAGGGLPGGSVGACSPKRGVHSRSAHAWMMSLMGERGCAAFGMQVVLVLHEHLLLAVWQVEGAHPVGPRLAPCSFSPILSSRPQAGARST